MAEYIERGEVIEKNHGGVVYIDDIKNIPSADVAHVRHGFWEKLAWWQHQNRYECNECSICGCRVKPKFKYNYCPNCGAKMMEG